MSRQDRNIWDDLVEVGREVYDRIEETLYPDRKRRKLARVPVPVQPNRRQPSRDDD